MRNMAILLLLVFIIPVVYQSSHVLIYHANDASQCCTLDETEASYYFDGGELNQHCVIAEYTFAHKDLPENQSTVSANFDEKEILNFYTHPGYRNFKLDKKSSRAPPFV